MNVSFTTLKYGVGELALQLKAAAEVACRVEEFMDEREVVKSDFPHLSLHDDGLIHITCPIDASCDDDDWTELFVMGDCVWSVEHEEDWYDFDIVRIDGVTIAVEIQS